MCSMYESSGFCGQLDTLGIMKILTTRQSCNQNRGMSFVVRMQLGLQVAALIKNSPATPAAAWYFKAASREDDAADALKLLQILTTFPITRRAYVPHSLDANDGGNLQTVGLSGRFLT